MEEEIIEKDMTPILIKDLGMRYLLEGDKECGRSWGLYRCQYCGEEFEHIQKTIKSGNTKSCGCLLKKGNKVHGLRHHPLYNIWNNMRARCYNPKAKNYKNYGARGIKVCDRWLDVRNFIEDMYPSYIEGLTLDRMDVGGNYEPDNCRWTTDEIQNRNTRDICKNNTSGYRGVSWKKRRNNWGVQIMVDNRLIYLGSYSTALEAAKAYERYVRLNNLEHNFTPALTEEEIEALNETK